MADEADDTARSTSTSLPPHPVPPTRRSARLSQKKSLETHDTARSTPSPQLPSRRSARLAQKKLLSDMTWTQIGDTMDGSERQCSHYSCMQVVAISNDGNRVAMGENNSKDCGHATVKVFDFDGSRWREVGCFSGRQEDDFGAAIALSGDGKSLAIGAPSCDKGGEYCGSVEIYEFEEGTGWKTVGRKLIGPQQNYRFGQSIKFSNDGSRIAIFSMYRHDFPFRHPQNGCVRVFEFDGHIQKRIVRSIFGEADWGAIIHEFLGASWKQIGQALCGQGDKPSFTFTGDGNVIAIGNEDDNYNNTVEVYRYYLKKRATREVKERQCKRMKVAKDCGKTQVNGNWTRVGNTLFGDYTFGFSLSINEKGNTLAVGHPMDEHEHKIILNRLKRNKWYGIGAFNLTGDFGESVSLTPDASRLAMGSEAEGEVLIFESDGDDWVLVGELKAPVSEKSFGSSFALSSNGDRIAVGSIHVNGTSIKGQLRVYEIPPPFETSFSFLV